MIERPPAHLRALVTDAFYRTEAFRASFEYALLKRRDELLAATESNVYCIAEADGSAWKIGLAQKPKARLRQLQIGNPRPLVLYAWAAAPTTLEPFLHHVLRRERIAGEWFHGRRTLSIVSAIEAAHEMGVDLWEDDEPADAEDTLCILTGRVEDALHEMARAA